VSRPASAPSWASFLGRENAGFGPIHIPAVAGCCVLVTGAGGFIGAEIVRVLAASGATQIVLLEIAEHALFSIHEEMAANGCAERSIPVLGSVCDRSLLTALFDQYRPGIVIHAAALKHVPLMERNPFAAVATNSIGTWRIAQLAAEHRARMILISTDKAVIPHSIMGASKRIAELAMLAHPGFTALRLVNVIGSPGSVAPIFAAQIAQGGPLTVTHPGALRFFMTLEEVVGLLARTIASGSADGVLVPAPCERLLIVDLARRMMAASGSDAPIVFTGLRPGDKIDEQLIAAQERIDGTVADGLRRVLTPPAADLDARVAGLESAIGSRDLPQLLRCVQDLVPDYQPSRLLREPAPQCAPAAGAFSLP